METLANRLQEAGLRPTPIRCDVFAVLQGTSGESVPHAAIDVYRRVARPGFALANVYRVLGELEAAGLARRSFPEAGRACVFSVCGAIQPGHLSCMKCHAVESVTDEWMQSRLESLAKGKGLVLQRHAWRMLGLCHACATSDRAGPRRRTARITT